jgi:hypothetical protein
MIPVLAKSGKAELNCVTPLRFDIMKWTKGAPAAPTEAA